MEKFTCWNAASVSETVFTDIGALSRSTDAVFLAAHTPARVMHLRGPEEPVGTGGGEAQVLAALLADVGTYPSNTLIAVTGNSGTGKSHIVRWVYAQLRQSRPDLHVLYVPRELSNLRDLLRTLIKGLDLPDEVGQEMLARVDAAIGEHHRAGDREPTARRDGAGAALAVPASRPRPGGNSRGRASSGKPASYSWGPGSRTGAAEAAWPT